MVTIRNFSNKQERNSNMSNKEFVIEIRYMLNAIAFFCCVAAIALWANSVAADIHAPATSVLQAFSR